jgi:hypothetical protein
MENASPMHAEVASAQETPGATCDACQGSFTARKRWQRFCSPKCRNDWHTWTKTVREARELVRQVLAGEAEPATWNPRARKLLGVK